jgi:hypothetical protein
MVEVIPPYDPVVETTSVAAAYLDKEQGRVVKEIGDRRRVIKYSSVI